MKSYIKGSISSFGRPPMTWKTLAILALFLILFLEWRRFNHVLNQEQAALESWQKLDDDSQTIGYGRRQLLKKLSNSAAFVGSTTTTAPPTFLDSDDTSFGDSVSLAHWIEARRKVYEARQRRVEAICQKFNVSTTSSNDTMEDLINLSVHNDSASGRFVERIQKDHFLLSRANQLMGCLINKVASSSMMRMYLTLQGIDHKKIESPHGFKTRFVPESEKELKFSREHFFKFMFVRHPMERLVSCYFDKMVNGTHKSLKGFRIFVKAKAENIRKSRRERKNRTQGVYAPEDLDLLDRPLGSYPNSNPWSGYKRNNTRSHNVVKRAIEAPKNNGVRTRNKTSTNAAQLEFNGAQDKNLSGKPAVIPTFDDFLEFILTDLSGQGFSSHWVPYWRMCTPCHFKYDMIGKLESGFDDFTYLWKEAQLDSKVPIPWYHAVLSTDQDAKEQHLAKMKSFYSKVPRKTLLRVYQAYKLDFELFDYDFNEVLKLAGHKPLS